VLDRLAPGTALELDLLRGADERRVSVGFGEEGAA
jgi:hypothetical protein